MKKITLSLITALSIAGSGFSQATYNLQAPLDDGGTSAFRAPNGTSNYAYQRTVMFIHEWELLPMNAANITTVSFIYDAGTGFTSPVPGSFTLYLANTTDEDMNQANNFTTVTSTMQTAYVGAFNVPNAAGSTTVPLTLTTPFSYNGGGLYVAWTYTSNGPFATNPATLASNAANTSWLYYNNSSTAPVNTFTAGTLFRPALIFGATNTATNEIEIVRVETPGKISKLEKNSQDVYVTIVNSSIGPQTGVTVSMTAVGANPATSNSVIANMAPGAIQTLTFTQPITASGQSTIVAAGILLTDQNPANNAKAKIQSASCNVIALPQPTVPVVDYTSYCVGNGLITGFKHTTGATASSITAVNVIIPSFTQAANSGKDIYPVVTDMSGAIIASGNTLNIAAANMGVSQALTFASPVALSPNTSYIFGVGTTGTGYFPVGAIASYDIPGYYQMPIGGGTPVNVLYGHLSLEATLAFGSVSVSASATKSVVCKKDGPGTVTLTATGLDTYTWTVQGSGSPVGTSSAVAVTPTTSASGGALVTYSVIGTDGTSGCKSTYATISVSVSVCSSIASNTSNGYDIVLFPNPALNGKAVITGLAGTNAITVFNTLGQVVLTQQVTEDTATIDISTQPAGNYLVKITDSNSETRTIKLVNQ